MEKFKFSKGEWEPQIDPDEAYVTCGDFLIADLLCSDVEESVMDANTYLIAAAPEMYSMLKNIEKMIIKSKNEIELADDVVSISHDLNLLLAKARGE